MSKYTTLHGDIIDIRIQSVLVRLKDRDTDTFIPLSVIDEPDRLEVEDDVEFDVATWFCEKNDLE